MQFVDQPERFCEEVARDLNVAMRFAHLLPMMKPVQKNRVRDVILAVPAEVLARMRSETPFVFKKCREAVARYCGSADANAFAELLDERLSTA